MASHRRMKALLFAVFLVLQSDQAVFVADNNLGSFCKSRIFGKKVKRRCRMPARASEIYTYCPALLREQGHRKQKVTGSA